MYWVILHFLSIIFKGANKACNYKTTIMIISDTSALVLNWTSKNIWESKHAQDYFGSLNLSAADTLFKKFDKEENYLQTQVLNNRKFFVRKCAVEFLEKCKKENVTGQVIILAAGIDPLSVEVASLYPNCIVFDIDMYAMNEKEKYLNNVCPNIQFIECDITNIKLLKETLTQKGWNTDMPAILIMEGITYYLHENDLRNVLTFFASAVSGLVCDFGLKAEFVNEQNRAFGIEIRRKITEAVGLEFMHCYDPDYYMSLLKQCGFKNLQRVTMKNIQTERTGESDPFVGDEPAWVALVRS